ncbi:hypothetical protein BC834DRAFT_1044464 [Gloeopeniophorella convolvens]|nr:hypothetical protein BC834DRAFT_1044464 [Gloeopeniophorella convolvens]
MHIHWHPTVTRLTTRRDAPSVTRKALDSDLCVRSSTSPTETLQVDAVIGHFVHCLCRPFCGCCPSLSEMMADYSGDRASGRSSISDGPSLAEDPLVRREPKKNRRNQRKFENGSSSPNDEPLPAGRPPPTRGSLAPRPKRRSEPRRERGLLGTNPRITMNELNDDVLLEIFASCISPDSKSSWFQQGTWLRLARVCVRWQSLLLSSASRLDLHLFFTNRSPLASMLASLPPFPIVMEYDHRATVAEKRDMADTSDEDDPEYEDESIHLLLRHCQRLKSIGLHAVPLRNLERFVNTLDDAFPLLERLLLESRYLDSGRGPTLPAALQAPHLRQLWLSGVSLPRGLALLASTTDLVILHLDCIQDSSLLPPDELVERLSTMHHLRDLLIQFLSPTPRVASSGWLSHTSTARIALSSLELLALKGSSEYLNNFLTRVNAPLLKQFRITLFNQLTFSLQSLPQFIATASVMQKHSDMTIAFREGSMVIMSHVDPRPDEGYLYVTVPCRRFDWQVSCAMQICAALRPMLSISQNLTLQLSAWRWWWKNQAEAERDLWRGLLQPFGSVRQLTVETRLATPLASALPRDDEEIPADLLPELREIVVNDGGEDALVPFADACYRAGRLPVTINGRLTYLSNMIAVTDSSITSHDSS